MSTENLNNSQPESQESSIDWMELAKKLWTFRKKFFISMPIAFVVAAIYAIAIPNFYDVTVKLAPELTSSSISGGSLSSLMRSFGVGGGAAAAANGMDAIAPDLYPDLMNSKTFLVSLFDIPVRSKKGDVQTTYYEYLLNYQKGPWWEKAAKAVGEAIDSLLPSSEDEEEVDRPAEAFALTKDQDKIAKIIEKKVVCDVDKKTYVITINVTDQDPVICATMADSVCSRLKGFITDYRTKKARTQMDNIQKQYDKAMVEYEEAKARVATYNASNWDLVNEDLMLQQQFLQNDMQLKYSALSAFNEQLIAARAQYEASRPVYTVLNGASVPIKKSGPKRVSMCIVFCFLVFAGQSAWLLKDDLFKKS